MAGGTGDRVTQVERRVVIQNVVISNIQHNNVALIITLLWRVLQTLGALCSSAARRFEFKDTIQVAQTLERESVEREGRYRLFLMMNRWQGFFEMQIISTPTKALKERVAQREQGIAELKRLGG